MLPHNFVEVTETGSALQSLIDIVHIYSTLERWRLKVNVKKVFCYNFFLNQAKFWVAGFGVVKALPF